MTFLNRLYIGGEWVAGSDGRTFPVVDPATGDVLTDFSEASLDDCMRAVDAAAGAQQTWAERSPRNRSEVLRRTFEILTAEREDVAALIVAENGKSYADAIAEADYAAEFFRWFSEEGVRIPGGFDVAPRGDKRIVVTRHPIGPSLLVTPWNYPAAMATRKLAPALAAGCTTILKPASETPLTAAYIVEALARAGVPGGVVNLVTPRPSGAAVAAILARDEIRKLSFTGSTEVGRVLLHACADTIVSASMELGGNAPVIVLPGADIARAIESTLQAKMRNGGSACTAANRIYVHSSLHEEFTRELSRAMQDLRQGPGTDRANDVGAQVSLGERDKIVELVRVAESEGAVVVTGGNAAERGAFIEPTVLTGVRHEHTISGVEVFGPVASVIEYDSVADVVEMANDTIYGLIAYVLGPEPEAFRVAQLLEFGMVAVNRGVASDPAAPFGGMKQSGLGREGGSEGIHEFLEIQYIATSLT